MKYLNTLRQLAARLPHLFGKANADYWSSRLADDAPTFAPAVYWLANPLVHAHYQARASGSQGTPDAHWVTYCLDTFLADRLPVANMLSLGCGTGDLELGLTQYNAFRHCDAYDIAAGAIETARARAHAVGQTTINFAVQDISRLEFPPGRYDAAWFNMSLHHIQPLEAVCARVAAALKPDGFLFVNEYVGPNRFAFTPRQKEAIKSALTLIPRRYRRRAPPRSGYQDTPKIPEPWQVRLIDPSEAIRSADILTVLPQYFEIETIHKTSGTLLQFLLHNIAQNFTATDPDSVKVLEMLFTIEDTLIDCGDLEADFVVVVARPKPSGVGARPAASVP